jgi:hypothetical protein
MPGDAQAVELADEGEGRPITGSPARVGPHAGHGQPGARLETERFEGLAHQPRRLDLFESHLCVGGDALAETDDLLGAAIDGLVDAPPKLVLARPGSRHRRLFCLGRRPGTSPMLSGGRFQLPGQLVGARSHGCLLLVWGTS